MYKRQAVNIASDYFFFSLGNQHRHQQQLQNPHTYQPAGKPTNQPTSQPTNLPANHSTWSGRRMLRPKRSPVRWMQSAAVLTCSVNGVLGALLRDFGFCGLPLSMVSLEYGPQNLGDQSTLTASLSGACLCRWSAWCTARRT